MHGITIVRDYHKLALLVLLLLSLMFIQCSNDNDERNTCDETKQPRIEPMFRVYFQVTNQGTPYTGFAKFIIEKHYCNGNLSGVFRDSTNAMIDGFWKPITTQYIMENDSDYVAARFIIDGHSDMGYYYFYQEVSYRSYIDEFGERIFVDTLKYEF
jgi:hypothetical protein